MAHFSNIINRQNNTQTDSYKIEVRMRVDGISQATTYTFYTFKSLVVIVNAVAVRKPRCSTSSFVVPAMELKDHDSIQVIVKRRPTFVPDRGLAR
jgi:hypothetical protein